MVWIRSAPRSRWRKESGARNLDYVFRTHVLIIVFAIGLYPERFRFWEQALSELSATESAGGYANTASAGIFILGFALSALPLARIALAWWRRRGSPVDRWRAAAVALAAVGALGIGIPHDVALTVHSVFSGLLVGGFWFWSTLTCAESMLRTGIRIETVALFCLLQLTVLPYAWMFAIDHPLNQIAQKLALFGLYTVGSILARSFAPEGYASPQLRLFARGADAKHSTTHGLQR